MASVTGDLRACRPVGGADACAELEQELASLRLALGSRDVIGQAKGLLMERYGLDAEQAFGVLVRVSQSKNVKLHEIAEDLIKTRQLPI